VGPTHAEACGWNHAGRAYEEAVQRAHATALIDVSVKGSWFWVPIVGAVYCTEVSGTAIRAN
jgi:hypothetical protein